MTPNGGAAGAADAAAPRAGQAPGASGGRRDASRGEAGAREPDRRTVWVLRGERPDPVKVRTGVSDGSSTEVVEGELKDGDLVVTDATATAGDKPSGGPGPRGPGRVF